jgi:hypothetical protein
MLNVISKVTSVFLMYKVAVIGLSRNLIFVKTFIQLGKIIGHEVAEVSIIRDTCPAHVGVITFIPHQNIGFIFNSSGMNLIAKFFLHGHVCFFTVAFKEL